MREPFQSGCVFVAPIGFRKRERLRDLMISAQSVIAPDSPDDALHAVDEADRSAMVVVDDLSAWSTTDQDRLARALFIRPDRGPFVGAARWLRPGFRRALMSAGITLVDSEQLRDDDAEIERRFQELDLSQASILATQNLSDGWPLIVDSVARSAIRHGGTPDPVQLRSVISEAVDTALGDVAEKDRSHLVQLGHADVLTQSAVDCLDPGLFERLSAAGVPFERTGSQCFRLLGAVREASRALGDLAPAPARQIAVALIEADLPTEAARLLIRAGHADDAAQILAPLSGRRLDTIAPHELLTTLDLLQLNNARFRRLHFVRARAYGNAGEVDRQAAELDLAVRAAEAAGDRSLRLEAVAERLKCEVMLDRPGPTFEARLEELSGALDEESHATALASMLDIQTLLSARSNGPTGTDQSLDLARRAVSAWESLGDPGRQAAAMRTMAVAVQVPAGLLGPASATIERALGIAPTVDLNRLRSLLAAIRIDALIGLTDGSRLAEASLLAEQLDLEWARAYVLWARVLIAGTLRRPDDVLEQFSQAHQMLGPLSSHPTGAVLTAEAADACARAGDLESARSLLHALGERRLDAPQQALDASLSIACRAGDVEDFDRSLSGAEGARPVIDWKAAMYRAVLSEIAGDDPAMNWRDVTERRASLCGCREALERLEPQVPWNDVDDDAPGRGLPEATTTLDLGSVPARVTSTEIRVLGCFDVRRAGEVCDLTSDRTIDLVKTMAIRFGQLPVEMAIDRLWPDTSPDVGRRRLKNVLARTRRVLGPAIERHQDALRFAEHVDLDVALFDRYCSDALVAFSSSSDDAVSSALQALGHYRGTLLPDDLYDDGIAPLRVALTSRAMLLVDQVLDAEPNARIGQLLLATILRVDHTDVARLERFARWATAVGDVGPARSAARQLRSIADELDMHESPIVRELLPNS